MPVKIRLARRGRKKQPFYHIVVADSRAKRDGKFIEQIGSYNPMTVPATIELDRDKAYDWLTKGAQPTDTARAILRFKGVMYKKHLMRGVKKGAMDQDQADKLYGEFIDAKEEKVLKRREEALAAKLLFWKQVSGEVKAPKATAPAEMAEEFREEAPATEDAAVEAAPEATAEAPAVEAEAPKAEEEPKAEETPVAEAPATEDTAAAEEE